MFDPDLFILMSDPESGGATLTAIGIDRFSAVWTIERESGRAARALLSAEGGRNYIKSSLEMDWSDAQTGSVA